MMMCDVGARSANSFSVISLICFTVLLTSSIYPSTSQLVVVPGYRKHGSSVNKLRIQRSRIGGQQLFTHLYGYLIDYYTYCFGDDDQHRWNRAVSLCETVIGGCRPNVCGSRHSRHCCSGWTRAPGSSRCLVPVCPGDCGDGECIRPNQCLCPSGQLASSCSAPGRKQQSSLMSLTDEKPQQTQASGSRRRTGAISRTCITSAQCQNGGTCFARSCVCRPGYHGPTCAQPVCPGGCGAGHCQSPFQCACPDDVTGDHCETEERTGPCYSEIHTNMCRGQLTGVVCTRLLCCATIGRAWGSPCEECPVHPQPCQRGFIYDSKDNKCIDVNECKSIPGLCFRGRCVNSVGSYVCRCDPGYRRNLQTSLCEDIDECSQTAGAGAGDGAGGLCAPGFQCINTDGSYHCRCMTSSDDDELALSDAPVLCPVPPAPRHGVALVACRTEDPYTLSLLLVHKTMLGHTPDYIAHLLTPVVDIPARSSLRASRRDDLNVPRTCRQQSFLCCCAAGLE